MTTINPSYDRDSDPRTWEAERRAASLKEIGLPLVSDSDDEWVPNWSLAYAYTDGHQPEFSRYKTVLVEWTSTLDDRITEVIDQMTEAELEQLVIAYAHKGACGFLWGGAVPERWKEGEGVDIPSGDWWSIETSDSIQPPEAVRKAHAAQWEEPLPTATAYSEYLRSDHWQHMRELALRHYGNSCVLCDNTPVDVHHRTYVRKGREWLEDLIVLCRDCHDKFHAP